MDGQWMYNGQTIDSPLMDHGWTMDGSYRTIKIRIYLGSIRIRGKLMILVLKENKLREIKGHSV